MSDLLWWWLQPSSLILTALVVVWIAAAIRLRRVAASFAFIAALAWTSVVVAPAAAWLAAPLEARHATPDALPPEVDGIVVLGGSVDARASRASGMLQLGAAGERMIAGAALARRYPQAVLAFTGVTAEALGADFVATPGPATLFGGPEYQDRRVVVLPGVRSTYEEAIVLLEQVTPRPGETWLLVTSAWHMPRAWSTFRTLGWTLEPYPVDSIAAGARWGWPSLPGAAERLDAFDTVVREWGAVWMYRRTGRITAEAWRDGELAGPTSDGP